MSQSPSLEAQRTALREFGVSADEAAAFTGIDPENEGARWTWAFSQQIADSPSCIVIDGRKDEPWSLLSALRDAADHAGREVDLRPVEDRATFCTPEGEVWEWPNNSPASGTAFVADFARVLGHGVRGFVLCEIDGLASSDMACGLLSAEQHARVEQVLGPKSLSEVLRPVAGPTRFRPPQSKAT